MPCIYTITHSTTQKKKFVKHLLGAFFPLHPRGEGDNEMTSACPCGQKLLEPLEGYGFKNKFIS